MANCNSMQDAHAEEGSCALQEPIGDLLGNISRVTILASLLETPHTIVCVLSEW